MKVSRDKEFINYVTNHPSVFPYVSFKVPGPFDMGQFLDDPKNIFLANDFGGFLFLWQREGVYEVHTQFLPEGRGRKALDGARWASQFMFTNTDCEELETYVADEARATILFTLRVGFEKSQAVEALNTAMHRYVLTREKWECLPRFQ